MPICFPWFGAHPTRAGLPAHGFARTRAFRLEGSELRGNDVVAALSLSAAADNRDAYPHDFEARLLISVGSALSVAFEVENRGGDPLEYELALHTYLSVSDVRNVELRGLAGASYDDKVSGARGVVEGPLPLRFVGETDRVYDSSSSVTVDDAGRGRRLRVDKRASATTVVWNPWIDKAKRMTDFGDDEWPQMLCVEAANVGPERVQLAPGAHHATSTTISAESL